MTTIKHGTVLPLESEPLQAKEAGDTATPASSLYFTWSFGYMFPELQNDPGNLLEKSDTTVDELRELGANGMEDPVGIDADNDLKAPGVPVPTIYTFFGQFVDHDITLERGSMNIKLAGYPDPIDPDALAKNIINSRSPNLDLDNVYGPDLYGQLAPRDPINPDKLRVDRVSDLPSRGLPPTKDIYNDLPRDDHGKALIGDPRDDENVVLAQLHLAFLRAHNALVDRGLRFGKARKLLRQHYQWIVLDDFLERIADPNIVKKIRFHGPKFFNPSSKSLFMPLEFSVAAFRFGHSKVRLSYPNANRFQVSAELGTIFSAAGHRISADWVIDWTAFLGSEDRDHFPRPIDTTLVKFLLDLDPAQLGPGDPEPNLAVRNLLRGYILRLPTGQAVARAMASQGIRELTAKQILSVAHDLSEDPSKPSRQEELLSESKFLLTRTPLWFYILAEAVITVAGITSDQSAALSLLKCSSESCAIAATPYWPIHIGDLLWGPLRVSLNSKIY